MIAGALGERADLYVDGEWVTLPSDGALEVVDPSTEATLGHVPATTAEGVDIAVRAARRAQDGWAATSVEERCAIVDRLADLLEAAAAEIGDVIAHEVGMPLAQATEIQAAMPVADLRITTAAARRHPFTEEVDGATVLREPAGIVAAITPWNFPLHQIAAKVGPALVAGCPVVLKPSEVAPFNAFLFADLADRAGVPAGVLGLVTGAGPAAGEALVSHPAVDVVSFTGSLRAGRRVGALAGEGVKRVCLELGGKSPSVVLDDADLERAVRHGITRGMLNTGQACNASTRIIVPAERLAEAEEIAVAAAEGIVVGPALADGVTMGPVVSATQRDGVVAFIEDGVASGARLLTGGPQAPVGLDRGFFVAPTVFSDVPRDARIAREEVFGPVLCLFGHDGEEDAIALANDTPFGLAAELWTEDPERARRVAGRLRAGQVKVGGVSTRTALGAPFGGRGLSGVGRELGRFGIDEFLEVKAVLGV